MFLFSCLLEMCSPSPFTHYCVLSTSFSHHIPFKMTEILLLEFSILVTMTTLCIPSADLFTESQIACYQEWNLIILIWEIHCHISFNIVSHFFSFHKGWSKMWHNHSRAVSWRCLLALPHTHLLTSVRNHSTVIPMQTGFVIYSKRSHSVQTFLVSVLTLRCHCYLGDLYSDLLHNCYTFIWFVSSFKYVLKCLFFLNYGLSFTFGENQWLTHKSSCHHLCPEYFPSTFLCNRKFQHIGVHPGPSEKSKLNRSLYKCIASLAFLSTYHSLSLILLGFGQALCQYYIEDCLQIGKSIGTGNQLEKIMHAFLSFSISNVIFYFAK